MADIKVENSSDSLTKLAAELSCDKLNQILDTKDRAVWGLAGGTAPIKSYEIIANQFSDKVKWQKVGIFLGDERCVGLNDPLSNWVQIEEVLLSKVQFRDDYKVRPKYELVAEDAARGYSDVVTSLINNNGGMIDLLLLGIGEDGHTLSLFPGQESLDKEQPLFLPIHNSPKPPPNRISLSLNSLDKVQTCFVITSGQNKAPVVHRAIDVDMSLPISRAISKIESNGGVVTWLIDKEAGSELN